MVDGTVTPEEVEDILRNGGTVETVSIRCGVKRHAVDSICRKMWPHGIVQQRRMWIAEYARAHPTASKAEIARANHVTVATVSKALVQHGIQVGAEAVTQVAYRVLRKCLDGEAACDIASAMGITEGRVQRMCEEARQEGFEV